MTAYQSLYRTWRPRTFTDMVGQEAIVRTLKNQVGSKRIAHAYLFCGSRGTGKTSAARIMAMAINCQEPRNGDPCLACAHCLALQSETTLDVFEMDAASNSRVEEIREMLSRTDYPPQTVPYKVYIIDEVHMLSNAAFNALLKTLEEPPPYMVFILATTEPQKLPATILSRCQRFDFGRIPESEIVKRLSLAVSDGVTADEDALQLIAATAQGSMRDAWSLMDMCLSAGGSLTQEHVRNMLGAVSQDFLFDFLDALVRGDTAEALRLSDKLMRGGRDVLVFLREFNAHLRQVLAVKWMGSATRDVSADQLRRYKRQADSAGADALLFFLEKCAQSENDARWTSSPRAVLELFALRCSQPGQERGEQAALARLDTLEGQVARLGRGGGTAAAAMKEAPADMEEAVIAHTRAQDAVQDARVQPAAKPPEPEENIPLPPEPDDPRPEPPAAVLKPLPAPDTEPQLKAAAPAPAAPPLPLQTAGQAAAPASSPKDAWNNLLRRLQKENAGLFAMVSRGKYGGYENSAFTLLMDEEDLIFASLLNEDSRASVVTGILSQEMGTAVRFAARGRQIEAADTLARQTEENIEALAREFGRDKIVLKND